MKPESTDLGLEPLPTSCLARDGKLPRITDDEHRSYIKSALARLDEVEQIPDGDGDPADALEQMMKGIDETRTHRPLFKGHY